MQVLQIAAAMRLHVHRLNVTAGLRDAERRWVYPLSIARALAGNPRILLFDEATSALDNRTQALVSRSIEGLQVTRIVIAHRLSTVINADRIYVLDRGRVVQADSCAELMGQDGPFRELAKRQLI